MAWRVEPEEALADALRRIAAEETALARSRLDAADGDRGEAVHVARRSFKRLRALLRLARPALGDRYAPETRRWRHAGRLLAPLRDAAVLTAGFDALVDRGDEPLPARGVAAIRKRLENSDHRHDGPEAERAVGEALAVIRAAEAELAALALPSTGKELGKGLRAGQKRLRRRFAAARADPTPQNLHECRKRVKDTAAFIRLFRAVLPDDVRKRRDDAEDLADILGEEHDLWILREKLTEMELPNNLEATRKRLIERIETRRAELCRSALKKGKALSSTRPKVFAGAIVSAWKQANEAVEQAG
jgi:CHAD domain-containing protein